MSALSSERNARVIELRKRQSLLDEFLRQTNLPKALRVRVREYSEFLTRKHKFLSEKALLEDLSPALRRAVNRHVNSDILDSVPVFKFGSSAFRTTMAQTLSPVLGVKVRGGHITSRRGQLRRIIQTPALTDLSRGCLPAFRASSSLRRKT